MAHRDPPVRVLAATPRVRTRVTQSAVWILLGYGARVGLQGIAFLLLARVLGPAEYGSFSAVFAAINVLAFLVEVGAGNLAVADIVAGTAPSRSLGNSLLVGVWALPTGLLVLLLVVPVLVPSASISVAITIGIASFVGGRLVAIAAGINIATDLAWRNAVTDFSSGALQLFSVAAAAAFGLTLEAWATVYLIQALAVAAFAFTWLVKRWGFPTAQRSEAVARIRPGLQFALSSATTYAGDLDKILLIRLASAETAGVFTAAHRVAVLAALPLVAFLAATLPRFFAAGNNGGIRAAGSLALNIMPVTGAIGLSSAAFIWFISPYLGPILGREYAEADNVLRWLAPLVILQGLQYPFSDALTGAGHQIARVCGQIAALIINVVLNLLLIPHYTWLGAAWAAIGAQAALLAFSVVQVNILIRKA